MKPSDITAQLLAKGSPDDMATTEFILQQIIFVTPKGSSAGYVAQRRREAEAFRIRFHGCDTSVEQAKGLKDVLVRPFRAAHEQRVDRARGQGWSRIPRSARRRSPSQVGPGHHARRRLLASATSRATQLPATEIEQKLAFEQTKDLGKDYLKELRGKAVIEYR